MMEDFKDLGTRVWSLQTGEWPTLPDELKKRPSAKAVKADLVTEAQPALSKPPYAALGGNSHGGER